MSARRSTRTSLQVEQAKQSVWNRMLPVFGSSSSSPSFACLLSTACFCCRFWPASDLIERPASEADQVRARLRLEDLPAHSAGRLLLLSSSSRSLVASISVLDLVRWRLELLELARRLRSFSLLLQLILVLSESNESLRLSHDFEQCSGLRLDVDADETGGLIVRAGELAGRSTATCGGVSRSSQWLPAVDEWALELADEPVPSPSSQELDGCEEDLNSDVGSLFVVAPLVSLETESVSVGVVCSLQALLAWPNIAWCCEF